MQAAEEEILDFLDCNLGLLQAQCRCIILGYNQLTHILAGLYGVISVLIILQI